MIGDAVIRRWALVTLALLALALVGHLVRSSISHAATLDVTAERLTVFVVGSPP